MQIHEEVHITVAGGDAAHVLRWQHCCVFLDMKPLWIELNTFERQLMCATRDNQPYTLAFKIMQRGFDVVRVKHEVQPYTLDVSTFDKRNQFLEQPDNAMYYECHVKFDGAFRPNFPMSSRDLLRDDRWYATFRQRTPFDPADFVDRVTRWAQIPDQWRGVSTYVGHEYEAVVVDTNPNLDAHWESNSR